MVLLVLGLFLWTAAHYFKRVFPVQRTALGAPGKGLVAVALFGALAMIVLGYRSADFIPIWQPPAFFVHLNNALVLLAFWIYGSGAAKGAKAWPGYRLRHPQLIGFKIWALAHLLVNGDAASVVLFAGLLIWAIGEVRLINRAEPEWTPSEAGGLNVYVRHAGVTLAIFSVVASIHIWLGVWPFPV